MRHVLALVLALTVGGASAETLSGSAKWEGQGGFSYIMQKTAISSGAFDTGEGFQFTVSPGTYALMGSCEATNNYYFPEIVVGPGEDVDFDYDYEPGYYVRQSQDFNTVNPNQSFLAQGRHLVAVSYVAGDAGSRDYDEVSCLYGSPYGPQVGPTIVTPMGFIDIRHNNATWSAGQVPLFPGEHYFIDWGPGVRPVYRSLIDAYPDGAFHNDGSPTPYDMEGCIAEEYPGLLSLFYNRVTGMDGALAVNWAQTFVGYGDYIGGAMLWVSTKGLADYYEVRIHEGLDGPQVGPMKVFVPNEAHYGQSHVVWDPWEVPIEDGQLYSMQFNSHNPYGTNNYQSWLWRSTGDKYAHGSLYTSTPVTEWVDQDMDMYGLVLAVGELPEIGMSDVRVEDVTDDAALVRWTTDAPAQGRVLYGVGGPDTSSGAIVYEKTEQKIVLMGLSPGAEYECMPNSVGTHRRYTEGPTVSFRTPAEPRPGVARNWGFERGDTSSWAGFGYGLQAAKSAYIGSFEAVEGSHLVYHSVYAGEHDGGLYQVIGATAGRAYEVRAQAGIYWAQEPELDPFDTRCRVGIDPAGGTDPAGGSVVWGSWATNPEDWTGAWFDASVRATALGSSMTVLLQYEMDDVKYWRVCCFDDVQVYPVVEGSYGSGWSLLAAPLDPLPGGSMAVSDLFSSDPVNALFRYGAGGYEVYPGDFTELQRGGAYWLYGEVGQGLEYVAARSQGAVSIPLNDGWSLIGSGQLADVPLADCSVTDGATTLSFADAALAGWLEDTFYGYDGGYVATRPSGGDDDALRGGMGYWVLANRPGLALSVPLP